jgi:hypothetical protein
MRNKSSEIVVFWPKFHERRGNLPHGEQDVKLRIPPGISLNSGSRGPLRGRNRSFRKTPAQTATFLQQVAGTIE